MTDERRPLWAVHPISRRDLVHMLLILLAAAALRLTDLGISEYAYDEATLSSLAQAWLSGQSITLGMMSSAQIPNFPASVYVMALPYLVSGSALVAVGFVAVLNVIGVGLLWGLAHRYLSPKIAIAAALAYALSPWAVLYSRKIWAQDFHTPFLLAGLLLALYGVVEGKRWAQALCLPVFVFALQIHFAAWALLPLMAWLLWIGRKRLSWMALALGAVLAALTFVPFIVGIAQSNVPLSFGQSSPDAPAAEHTLPLLHTLWLVTGGGIDSAYTLPAPFSPVSVLWLALLPLGAIGASALWQRSRSLAVLVLLWALLPTLVLLFFWKGSQPHYYVASIPAYTILIGAGVVWLARPPLRLAAPLLLSLILVTQALQWRSLLHTVDTTYVEGSSGFHTLTHYYTDIAAALADDVLIFGGTESVSGYTLWSPLLYRQAHCVREVIMADGGVAVLPPGNFSVLTAPNAPNYDFTRLYTSVVPQRATLRPGEGEYRIDNFAAAPEWDDPALTPVPASRAARFDNGVVLNGYTFASGRLYLDWSLPEKTALDYQYFAHLLNTAGDRIAQRDASFYSGKYWCDGDRIITWIDMDRPAEVAVLRVGFYYFDDNSVLVGVNLLDAAGHAAAPWIDIPLEEN